jgi:hypothetical protein
VFEIVGGEMQPEIAADPVRRAKGAHDQAHLFGRRYRIGAGRIRQAAGGASRRFRPPAPALCVRGWPWWRISLRCQGWRGHSAGNRRS